MNPTSKQCDKCGQEYSTPYCCSVLCLSKKIIKVEKNPNGGFLTYIEGYKYPLRAYPESRTLDSVALVKRAIIASIRFVFRITSFFSPSLLFRSVLIWLGDLYGADYGNNLKIPLENYSEPTQEVIRVLNKINPHKETAWISLAASIYDTDVAYRTRGQDWAMLLDKKALADNPRKEILRILDIGIARELSADLVNPYLGQKGKLAMFRRLISLALLINPFRDFIISFCKELDTEKMKFDVNDQYWLSNKFDYNYEGKTFEERMAWRIREEENWKAPEIAKEMPQIAIYPPNKAFYEMQPKEAEELAERTKQALLANYRSTHI